MKLAEQFDLVIGDWVSGVVDLLVQKARALGSDGGGTSLLERQLLRKVDEFYLVFNDMLEDLGDLNEVDIEQTVKVLVPILEKHQTALLTAISLYTTKAPLSQRIKEDLEDFLFLDANNLRSILERIRDEDP